MRAIARWSWPDHRDRAVDALVEEEADKNPFFRKVHDSQRAYASKVVTSRLTTAPSYNTIAEHYWREKKPQAPAK